MQKYADLMMCIIKNEVCGGECEFDLCALTEDDIKALYAISNAHDLSHLLAPAMGAGVYCMGLLPLSTVPLLLLQVISGVLIYVLLCTLLRIPSFMNIATALKKRWHK